MQFTTEKIKGTFTKFLMFFPSLVKKRCTYDSFEMYCQYDGFEIYYKHDSCKIYCKYDGF